MSETNDTTREGVEAQPKEATEVATEEALEPDEVSEMTMEEHATKDSKDAEPKENPIVVMQVDEEAKEVEMVDEEESKEDPKLKESPEGEDDETIEAKWIKAENEAKQQKMETEAARQGAIQKKKIEDEEKARQDEVLMHPKREHFQRFVNTVSLFATLASFAMAVGQILGPALYEVSQIQWILRIYVVFLCFIMILVECSWTQHVRESSILRSWIPRGIFYIFIGVLGLEENEKSTFRNLERSGLTVVQAYVTLVAYVVIAFGFAYMLLGAACMQKSYIKQCQDYQERLQVAVEMRHPRKGSKEEGSSHSGEDAV